MRPVISRVWPRAEPMAAGRLAGSITSIRARLLTLSMRGHADSVEGPPGSSASTRTLAVSSGRANCQAASWNSRQSPISTTRLGRTSAKKRSTGPSTRRRMR